MFVDVSLDVSLNWREFYMAIGWMLLLFTLCHNDVKKMLKFTWVHWVPLLYLIFPVHLLDTEPCITTKLGTENMDQTSLGSSSKLKLSALE